MLLLGPSACFQDRRYSSPVLELDLSVGPLLLFRVSPYFIMYFLKGGKILLTMPTCLLSSALKKGTTGQGCREDGNNFVAVQFWLSLQREAHIFPQCILSRALLSKWEVADFISVCSQPSLARALIWPNQFCIHAEKRVDQVQGTSGCIYLDGSKHGKLQPCKGPRPAMAPAGPLASDPYNTGNFTPSLSNRDTSLSHDALCNLRDCSSSGTSESFLS